LTSKGTAAKQPQIAFWLETASQAACEIAALVGYRIVLLDMEHGVLSLEAADRLIPFCQRLGLVVYSRVAAAERVPIQHALDAGADGVILPQVRDARHAREVAAFAKYPPLGSRGIGYSRTMDYGATPAGFVEAENRRTRCYAMIETTGALAEVDAIAALTTVDGLFIGPSDLSLARGRGAYRATPADVADARRVAAAAAAARKPWAMPAPDPRVLAFAARHGAGFVTVSDDLTALRVGFAQGLAKAKGGERRR
jgi:4-hydroxy-2-oxoheptanedioate aldolase